jgi:hypothetical protein
MYNKVTRMQQPPESDDPIQPALSIERAQLGVRMEKRMVKVLKGLAEYLDLSLGDLLEGMVLHAFANTPPFNPTTLQRIEQLKQVYGLEYDQTASHRLTESTNPTDSV